MTRKKSLAIVFVLTFVSSVVQAFTFAYPTKSALKKADHVASLATSVILVSAFVANEYKMELLAKALVCSDLIALGANSVVNGMALKHERSLGTILKFLLPTGTIGGCWAFYRAEQDTSLEDAGFYTIVLGYGMNGIKNIWDIYSLIKYNPSEGTQHDV